MMVKPRPRPELPRRLVCLLRAVLCSSMGDVKVGFKRVFDWAGEN